MLFFKAALQFPNTPGESNPGRGSFISQTRTMCKACRIIQRKGQIRVSRYFARARAYVCVCVYERKERRGGAPSYETVTHQLVRGRIDKRRR